MKLRRAYRTSLKCFALAMGRYESALGGAINDVLAARIRGEQVRSVLRQVTAMMIATVFNAVILVLTLSGTASPSLLCSWALLLAGASGIIIVPRIGAARHFRHGRASPGVSRRINGNALLLGGLWGAMPVLFFAEASQSGRFVIACIAAGMIGGAAFAFSAIPSAAIAMIVPIALGSIWALAQVGGSEFTYTQFTS